MEKTYQPKLFEQKIYDRWMDKKYFRAVVDHTKKPFTTIMPPPNITSNLHMGHAFQETIQDIIVRRKRMQGFSALWLPGTDHAAIATEVKVVEQLAKEGITKEEIGREEFSNHIFAWYDKYKNVIINQFKRMGYSCDWERLTFTMDEKSSLAVRTVFVKLFNKGYIYKGKRLVNWCSRCKTSISDAEVDFVDNKSFLWYFKYAVENSDEFLTFATTRPETILGDTAVAVNPKDERYTHLVGKNVVIPVIDRIIPVVADDYVDIEFGTGVVKITPAHDPNDFEVGLRHNLPQINIMNEDGTLNENAGKYQGMHKKQVREKIVEDFKELGAFVKQENYENNIGQCDRCHEVIEPLISNQWFVKMSELAVPAIEVVENGRVHFLEDMHKKIYLHWMKNIKDWCISRQLWSGHRIPIFTCGDCGEVFADAGEPTVCPKCNSDTIVQETDTLDTWFSSALWPFSTLGYPNDSEDLAYFYPSDVMVTAQEIIQLWVARMIFTGLEFMNDVPFRTVLINGTVKDANGKKMSKSLGNGVDPIDIIEKYSVDILRFSLYNGVAINSDSRFSEKKVELIRNFINKIWNASYFVVSKINDITIKNFENVSLTLGDKWMLHELNEFVLDINKKYDNYELGQVASDLYDFFWTKFCDWYIEIAKVNEGENSDAVYFVLNHTLKQLLKLMHPFIPFVTEEIYLQLQGIDESIMISNFPSYDEKFNFETEHTEFKSVRDLIRKIRNVRAENKIADNKKTELVIQPLKGNEEQILEQLKIIEKLTMSKDAKIVDSFDANEVGFVSIVTDWAKVYVKVSSAEGELERLQAELTAVEGEITRSESMLSNAGFVAKAPQKLVDAEKEKLEKFKFLKENLINSIKELKG